ncbi:hypothetical protein INT43_005070 [Umbelopsis isabellina]|uniref:F-box domain-containing protein n=1 Tax=Mortierella isabellina TaxID=91625 RepID=A0A8H7PGQ5_MORIS|nr:hypothetical protein INT43_005070 [Umbelopsis isabellina]
MYSLEEFPVEILYNTLQYVNTSDLAALIQVNRRWESIVYEVCYKRVQNLMAAGWTVMVDVDIHDTRENASNDAMNDNLMLMTVLDKVEPKTLNLVFNLHEALLYSAKSLQEDTNNSIAVFHDTPSEITISTSFIGLNSAQHRINYSSQLEAIDLYPQQLDQELGSDTVKLTRSNVSTPPARDASVEYKLTRSSRESISGIPEQNAKWLTDSSKSDNDGQPVVLRLEKFICSLKWFLFNVDSAIMSLDYSQVDQISIW